MRIQFCDCDRCGERIVGLDPIPMSEGPILLKTLKKRGLTIVCPTWCEQDPEIIKWTPKDLCPRCAEEFVEAISKLVGVARKPQNSEAGDR